MILMSFARSPLPGTLIRRFCHSELSDPQVRRIRWIKRLFSFGLFGGTLLLGLVVRNRKRQQDMQLMHETRRIGSFGNLPIFEYKGYVLAEPVLRMIKRISEFQFRDDDIILLSFPKTGTTWLQEILWLLLNDLDYEKAKVKSIDERFPYLEFPYPGITTLSRERGRRLIKTHVAPSLLNLNEEKEKIPKLISIVRDPRDVIVSFYYFSRSNNLIGFTGSFGEFFSDFVNNKIPYGPMRKFNDEISDLEKEQVRVLILKYEDLKSDFTGQIERICSFLELSPLTSEQMRELKSHCSFEEMSRNPAVNYGHWKEFGLAKPDEAPFMRKGEVGDWKNHLIFLNSGQQKVFESL